MLRIKGLDIKGNKDYTISLTDQEKVATANLHRSSC